MKTNLLVTVLILGQGLFAHATGNISHFQKVLAMYAQGSKPTLEQVSGAWAGRCFYTRQNSVRDLSELDAIALENTAHGMVMAINAIKPNEKLNQEVNELDGGPLFKSYKYKGVIYELVGEPFTRFDDASAKDILDGLDEMSEVGANGNHFEVTIGALHDGENALAWTNTYEQQIGSTRLSIQHNLRTTGQYLVALGKLNESSPGTYVPKGKTLTACYFFKKLK